MLLKNKNIVITGGAGLLAQALAKRFTTEGAKVVLADIHEDRLQSLCQDLNSKHENSVMAATLDITSKESILAMIDKVSSQWGGFHGLVNCAYPRNKSYGEKFEEVSFESFCENTNSHLGGYFLTTQQIALYFKEQGGGDIINIASIYGLKAPRFEIYQEDVTMPVEYSVIKAGVIQLNQYAAKYFKGQNIRFNCISPGGLLNNQDAKFLEKYNEHGLNKGMLEAEDVAGTCVFLLSDLSTYINGQNLVVDDGWCL